MTMAGPAPQGRAAALTRRGAWLVVLAVLLAVTVLASYALGSRQVPPAEVIRAFLNFDPQNTDHLVVRDLRGPRTMLGLAVGAAMAVAGVIMQGLTRNPLADPGLMGVNAGAALAVVLAIRILHVTAMSDLIWFALTGAAIVTALVLLIGMRGSGQASPVRLVLAGFALTALLGTFTSGILLTSQETLQVYRFWAVGSLAASDDARLLGVLPMIAGGAIAAIGCSAGLTALSLGDETAAGLGVRVMPVRILALVAIAGLCGGAVAAAGPITFIGLVVPHLARLAAGADIRWQLPAAALAGPVVLLLSDIAGRMILPPGEIQAGIMVALIGGPFFVHIARRATRK